MASRIVPLQAIATGTGVATVKKTPPNGYTWTVSHIGIASTSVLGSVCSVYQNNNFICGSQTGNNDAADGSPMTVYDTDEIEIIWQNATPTAVCTATLIVDEEPKGQ